MVEYIKFLKWIFKLSNIYNITSFFLVLTDIFLIKLISFYFSESPILLLYSTQSILKSEIVYYLFLLFLVKFITSVLNQFLLATNISNFSEKITLKLYKTFQSLKYENFTNVTPDFYYKLTDLHLKNVSETYQVSIQGFNEISLFLFYLILAIFINLNLTLTIIGFILLFIFIIRYKLTKLSGEWGILRVKFEGVIISKYRKLIENFKQIKIDYTNQVFLDIEQDLIKRKKYHFLKVFLSNIPKYIIEIFVTVVLLIAYYFREIFNVTTENFIVIFFLLVRAIANVNNISNIFQSYLYNRESINEIKTFLNIGQVANFSNYIKIENQISLIKGKNISLIQEKLKYKDFTIPLNYKNVTIIQGESGVGKTSFVEMLMDLKQFNGELILSNKSKDLIFGYVSKDFKIIYNSLNDFFKYSSNEISINFKSLLNYFNFDFLNNKYFGDNCEFLSTGQSFKLALIDGLKSKPNILIIDEAFTSISVSEEEKLIKKILDLDFVEHIIIISHRTTPFYKSYNNIFLKRNLSNEIEIVKYEMS